MIKFALEFADNLSSVHTHECDLLIWHAYTPLLRNVQGILSNVKLNVRLIDGFLSGLAKHDGLLRFGKHVDPQVTTDNSPNIADFSHLLFLENLVHSADRPCDIL